MEITKLSKRERLSVDYTIQSRGEKNEDNLWNTVATYLWSTTELDEAKEILRDGESIVWMLSKVDDWDDLGDCIEAGYVEII